MAAPTPENKAFSPGNNGAGFGIRMMPSRCFSFGSLDFARKTDTHLTAFAQAEAAQDSASLCFSTYLQIADYASTKIVNFIDSLSNRTQQIKYASQEDNSNKRADKGNRPSGIAPSELPTKAGITCSMEWLSNPPHVNRNRQNANRNQDIIFATNSLLQKPARHTNILCRIVDAK